MPTGPPPTKEFRQIATIGSDTYKPGVAIGGKGVQIGNAGLLIDNSHWGAQGRIMKSRHNMYAAMACSAIGLLPLLARAQLVDLGEVTAHAINNKGQVALDQGIYGDGAITPLPALPNGSTPATAVAINNSGWAVGGADSPPSYHPVEFINGALIDFASSLFFQGQDITNSGGARGINSSGEVVSYYRGFDGTGGFTYLNGTITFMSVPCGVNSTQDCSSVADNQPYGINDGGKITGTIRYNTSNFGSSFDAYIYDNGAWTDLGPGAGYAINAVGQVTGDLEILGGISGASIPTATSTYAFLYANGNTTNLGTLPGGKNSTGYAISDTGQVVGSSDFAGSGTATHAFLYNGLMNDLNTLISATDPLKPYVTLTSAVGINDSLLIVANGVDSRTGKGHAYLYQASFVQIAPTALNFAMLSVGEMSEAQSVTVTNSGATAIPVEAAYVNGDFSLRLDTCGSSLAPGAQCRVAVAFLPKIVGALAGTLTIPAAGADYRIPLTGVAPITAKISASTDTATVGAPVTLTWAVSPGSTCVAASSNPDFTGSVAVTGKQTVTETVAGTENYTLNCTGPGVAAVTVSTSVTWSWPPVTLSVSASPSTIAAGQSTTIIWTASNATSCTATGGGPADNWAGAKTIQGSQAVTEAFAPQTASVVLTFDITCTSTTSGLSRAASVKVTETQVSGAGSGGPPTATISASLNSITVNQPETLTWKSSNATSCTATGGGDGDNWAGPKATSGSATVTESVQITSGITLTFGITCISSATGQSAKGSVNVVEGVLPQNGVGPQTSSGGGGGALNAATLALLAGLLALRRARARMALLSNKVYR
jgi:probable HAF family extracellular repeat protein